MTAPNKMAKRAAAGTLALAVCFGGGILGAGAANAAIAANAATVTASSTNPNLIVGAAAASAGTVTVNFPAAVTFAATDTFTLTAPTGITISGSPTVTVTPTGSGAITTASAAISGGNVITVTLPGSSDGTQAESLAISGVQATVAAGTSAGQKSWTTNLPGVASLNLATVQVAAGIETAATLPIVSVGTTAVASPVTIKGAGSAWNAGDTLRFTLSNGYSFSKAPTVAISGTATGANATTQLRAVPPTTAGGPVLSYDLTFVDAIETGSGSTPVTSSDITVALTDISVTATAAPSAQAVNLGITKGVVNTTTPPTTLSGTVDTNFFAALANTVKIADASAVSVTATAGQTLITGGGSQLVSPIRIAEVASADAGLVDGAYTFTFSNATVANPNATGFKASVAGPARLGTPTVTQNSANSVTVTVAGTNNLANDYFELSNLYVSPTGGTIDITVTGPNGVVLPTGKVGSLAVSATAERVGGLDRYATAAQISTALKGSDINPETGQQPTRVDNIILAQGGFQTGGGQAPDALTANYLSGRTTVAGTGPIPVLPASPSTAQVAAFEAAFEAATSKVTPILLTDKATVPSPTLQAITSAFAVDNVGTNAYSQKTITIVGGESAVSADVVKALREALPGVKIVRVEGADRYATAASIVLGQAGEPVRYSPTFNTAKVPTAVIASGENSADALSAGAITAEINLPLLLTEKNRLPQATKDALSAKGIGRVVLLGGTNAVSQAVEDDLKKLGIEVERFGGATRYETSAALLTWAKKAAATSGTPTGGGLGLSVFNSDTVYLTNGDTFADALVVGPLSSVQNRNVVLTQATSLPSASSDFIKSSDASFIVAIGLETAVPATIVTSSKAAANGTSS